jgi:dihydroorotate dehydrogenase electron transfer subunit
MTGDHRSGAVPLVRLPDDGPLAPPAVVPHLLEAPIVGHVPVGAEYWRLTLAASAVARAAGPGQFVMLTIARQGDPAPVLPRPMAIYARDRAAGTIDVVYRVVGEGTRRLTDWRVGEAMVTVGPLGRGFVVPSDARRIVLLGRGIGTCSLTVLAAEAAAAGVRVAAVASARHAGVLIGPDTYRAAGAADVLGVVDEDGSSAPSGLAPRIEAWCADGVDELYVCGSARLLALAADAARRHGAGVQVSLEAHMACGLGFCHGCAAGRPGVPHETPLVCADGPVFRHDPSREAAA